MQNLINTWATKEHIVRETEKALLVEIHARRARDGSRLKWLPKSQVTWVDNEDGFVETIHVPGWLARSIAWA